MITFAVTNVKLFTLDPLGAVKKELVGVTEFNRNRIGEYKKMEIYYTASSLANVSLYFDPALFFNISAINPISPNQPTSYWGYQVDAAVTVGISAMTLVCPIPYIANLIKNWEVSIEIVNATDFVISIKYFHIYDTLNYLTPNVEVNHAKLLKDRLANPTELSVSGDSVYTNAKVRPQFYIYGKDATDFTIFGSINHIVDNYQAGFYRKNAHQAPPYFIQESFILEDTAGVRTSFSSIEDTKVRFRTSTPGSCTSVYCWLIRTDTNDNTTDFLSNYEASFADIVTAGPGTIHNKIVGPATSPALVLGQYEVSFYVNKALLVSGGKYRVIAIPYDDTNPALTEVNSFISSEYSVALPSYNGGLNITGSIKDYIKEYTGNDLICVVEERLQSKLNIDFTNFSADILARLGLVVANDIRRYLTKVTCEIYTDPSATLRHYMARSFAVKMDPITYSVPFPVMALNFTVDNLEILFNYRNRYEPGTPNIQSVYMPGEIPLSSPTSNQFWGGKVLKVKFSMELFYDDYSTPFTDKLVFIQTIRPKTYDPISVEILKEDGEEIGNAEYFCSDVESCFKAKLNQPNAEEYKLITTTELAPGSIASIEENEVFVGILGQSTTSKIASQEESFSQTEIDHAKFCYNNSQFSLDLPYKISAIAKKIPPVIPFNARITEDDIVRDLETIDFRIIE